MPTVLISGASDGIGRALAAHYAAAGARVLGLGRRAFPEALGGAIRPADYLQVDLARPGAAAAVLAFVEERGINRLDAVIHNAALGWYGPPAAQSAASIDELLAVNLAAPVALTHALLPRLAAAHGVAVFVSSVHSALPAADFAVYTATKAALDGFARNLRIEERGRAQPAPAVITVWPGATRTGMHAKSGVPAQRIRAERYMPPDAVAAQIARAVEQRRSRAIGRGNGLLRWLARHLEPAVDWGLAAAQRRRRT